MKIRRIISFILIAYYFYSQIILSNTSIEFGIIVFVISTLMLIRILYLGVQFNKVTFIELKRKYFIFLYLVSFMFLLFFAGSNDPFDLNLAALFFYSATDTLYDNIKNLKKDSKLKQSNTNENILDSGLF